MRNTLLNKAALARYLPLVAGLLLIFAAGAVFANGFLTVDNQRDVLERVAINGILAVGMTLVILTAGIDLSVGSLLSLCSVVAAMLIMPPLDADAIDSALLRTLSGGAPVTLAHLVALPVIALAGGLVGMQTGRLVSPARRAPRLAVSVGGAAVTAALALWWGLAQLRHGGDSTLPRGFSTLSVFIIVPLVGGALGAVSGLIIAKTKLQPFIITLAMMIFAVGFAKFVAGDGGRIHTVESRDVDADTGEVYYAGADPSFVEIGTRQFITVGSETTRSGKEREIKLFPAAGLFMLGAWCVAAFVLIKLPLGRHVYAVGGNEEAARLSGIRTDRVKIFVYAACGLLAGLAAVLYAAKYRQGKADAGQMMELDAIAAVVIGGTSLMGGRGSIFGTLVGVMIFGYLSNILNLRAVPSEVQQVLQGVIIVTAAAVQSETVGAAFGRLRRRLFSAGA